LANKHPRSDTVRQALAYFRKNRKRMRYADLKARGFMIGSGIVEAACKTLVAQRLKQSGMRWSAGGAQAILTPRGGTRASASTRPGPWSPRPSIRGHRPRERYRLQAKAPRADATGSVTMRTTP
jgi:hypothetical protein